MFQAGGEFLSDLRGRLEKRLAVAGTFAAALQEGGYLVIGRTESLPRETVDLFEPVFPAGKIYRLRPDRG